MNFRCSFHFRKIIFFYLLISCGWLASCGLRTAPRNLPEIKQKPTFSDLKVQQRGERIRLSWKINETERTTALKKLDGDPELKEYFLIQEHQIPLDCGDCETVVMAPLRILFSSNSIIRDGNHLYYYLELPGKDLKLREYELSHMGPEDEILSPAETVKFRQSKLFPKVPAPRLKIIQIEDEKQIVKFSFGKVVLKKTTVIGDDTVKLLEQKKVEADNTELNSQDKKQEIKFRTFVLRLTWPQLTEKGLNRLKGEGDYFEEHEFYQVHLYRTRSGEVWPETPINSKSSSINHYLDRLKVYIPPSTYPHMADTHPDIAPPKLSFYIDLLGQNSDTWLYKLRLVDRFGNESNASETVRFQPPETMILEQSFGQKTFVPLSD